jgi:hypothetical protein
MSVKSMYISLKVEDLRLKRCHSPAILPLYTYHIILQPEQTESSEVFNFVISVFLVISSKLLRIVLNAYPIITFNLSITREWLHEFQQYFNFQNFINVTKINATLNRGKRNKYSNLYTPGFLLDVISPSEVIYEK